MKSRKIIAGLLVAFIMPSQIYAFDGLDLNGQDLSSALGSMQMPDMGQWDSLTGGNTLTGGSGNSGWTASLPTDGTGTLSMPSMETFSQPSLDGTLSMPSMETFSMPDMTPFGDSLADVAEKIRGGDFTLSMESFTGGEHYSEAFANLLYTMQTGGDASASDWFSSGEFGSLYSNQLYTTLGDLNLTSQLDGRILNAEYLNASSCMAGAFSESPLAGQSVSCVELFNSQFGNLAESLKLSTPEIPESFSPYQMLGSAQSSLSSTYSSITNSGTFASVKNSISIGNIFNAAKSGMSSGTNLSSRLMGSNSLSSMLSGISGSAKSSIAGEFGSYSSSVVQKGAAYRQQAVSNAVTTLTKAADMTDSLLNPTITAPGENATEEQKADFAQKVKDGTYIGGANGQYYNTVPMTLEEALNAASEHMDMVKTYRDSEEAPEEVKETISGTVLIAKDLNGDVITNKDGTPATFSENETRKLKVKENGKEKEVTVLENNTEAVVEELSIADLYTNNRSIAMEMPGEKENIINAEADAAPDNIPEWTIEKNAKLKQNSWAYTDNGYNVWVAVDPSTGDPVAGSGYDRAYTTDDSGYYVTWENIQTQYPDLEIKYEDGKQYVTRVEDGVLYKTMDLGELIDKDPYAFYTTPEFQESGLVDEILNGK